MPDALPLPPSLYAGTARLVSPTPPLDGDRGVSAAIVGGGFMGLSTARSGVAARIAYGRIRDMLGL